MNALLQHMEREGYVVLEPKSHVFLTAVGDVNDDGTLTKTGGNDATALVQPTHALLTFDGKNKAEEHKALLLKARRAFILAPIFNSIVSGVVGFALGYVFHLFI